MISCFRLFAVGGVELKDLAAVIVCVTTAGFSTVSNAQTEWQVESLSVPEDGGARRLEVTVKEAVLYRDSSEKSDQLAVLPQSVVLSNLGCAEVAGQVWCRVAERGRARVGYVAASHVAPATGPDGIVPMGIDDSKRRARKRDFDDTREIACAQNVGESLGRCTASVARSGGGDATVIATFSNSFTRELYFTHGEFMRGNSTMSGVGTDTEWQLESGTYAIRVDDQRFEIPQSFILGE